MLSDALRKTGILADKGSSFSDRVRLPCATKIRKTSKGFNFIVSTLNLVNSKFVQFINREVEVTNHGAKGQANVVGLSVNAIKKYWTEKYRYRKLSGNSPAKEKFGS